jgi:hypothetical protein
MKRIILIALLSFIAFDGFSQASLIGVYGGAGCATKYNYDVAPSGGLELLFSGHRGGRIFIGADIFYQSYSLYADNEVNSAHNRTGYTGTTDRFLGSYAFVAPKFSFGISKTENIKIHVSFGVGFKVSGFDSLHKWNDGYYANAYYTNPIGGTGQYDSLLDKSKNINTMVLRASVGMTEYLAMGTHWRLTFTEDFGFVAQSLTKTGTSEDGSRSNYSTNGLRPGYISLQVGISHYKLRKKD